jgi:(p)ppGpp synthase/HD superfamily hydrolase
MHAEARAFAIEAHGAQTYGGGPYVTHLDAVAALVPNTPSLKAVAYLHDVLEDTAVGYVVLADRFGPTIADAVELVTDPDGTNRKERKAKLHARLAALSLSDPAPPLALHVKVADRLANVRACVQSADTRLSMYRREHEDFRPAAFRAGLCDSLWAELDALLA